MTKLRSLFVAFALLAFCGSNAWAQQRRLTGRVTGEGGEPLIAAQVVVVGTTLGGITNEEGRYSINAPDGALQLRVRRIGYKATTVSVAAGQNEQDIRLSKDVLQLEKQIVTGAATTVASANATQDVAVVSGEQLNRVATPTVENALQGKIAGAQIVQNSGAPGGGMQVRLRGVTSLYGNSEPLYVVDGVIVSNAVIQPGLNAVSQSDGGGNTSDQDNGVNRIADLNPADIENIEVLKGASASSIYGAKGSNGVIIITTKTGRVGRTDFNVTQRLGTFDLANEIKSIRFANVDSAIAYDARTAELGDSTVRDNYARCGGFCDFEKQVYGEHELSYETDLSVRGGTQNTRFFASGLVKRDGGIVQNSGYNKQALRLNLNQAVGSRLQLSVNTNLLHSLTQRSISNNDNINATPYFVFGSTPSYYDLRPRAGGVYPTNPYGGSNPLQTVALLQTPSEVYRLIGAASANYNIFSNEGQSLSFKLDGGVDQFVQQDNINSPRELQFEPNDGLPGTVTSQSGLAVNVNYNAILTHQFFPASKAYQATTSFGLQREQRQQRSTMITTRGVPSGQTNIDRGAAPSVFADRFLVRDLAMFLNEDFLTLGERLLVSAGVRGQKSTVNGDVNRIYYFPKVSASYRLPSFLSSIDEFKLRSAYGIAGNAPNYATKYSPLQVTNYEGQVGIGPGTILGNSNVTPEISREYEGGFDLTAFNSRASLNFTVYQKSVSDLLLQPIPAPSVGYSRLYQNGGALRNRGTEIQLALTPYQAQRASWISRTTFSRNVGVVTELPNHRQFNIPGSFGYGNFRIQEGQSPTSIFGPDSNGVDYKYGDTAPDFVMGFSNEFTFGPVRLYGLFDWQHGGDIINITRNVYDETGLSRDVAAREARLHSCDDNGDCSPYVEDGSFVKLREVTVGYELPSAFTSRLFGSTARTIRAELSGRNLLTWTKYSSIDPEVSNFGNQNVIRNADLAPFPPTRSYFFTFSVDF
ncbi:MAG TPA: SusC/RagA family TonB-linked outer membrane protein [Gemmatimonadaceae bacterium]|nr:SusC/RagA family TonB-linked outer membrane protein [Gemmatimonadaceae bacterium]